MSLKLYNDPYDEEKYMEEHKDHILVKGGDGSLLKAISMFRHRNKPFFGVGKGTVNFLMNVEDKIHYNHKLQKLNLLEMEVEFLHLDNTVKYYAFNDIVIGNFNAWIDFKFTHKDMQIGDFKGSGVVISTAQGTTGINRNNNGTILPLSSLNWSVTGMQCNKNVNSIVESSGLSIECKSRMIVKMAIDGNDTVLENIKRVTVSRGPEVEVIFNDISEFAKKKQ